MHTLPRAGPPRPARPRPLPGPLLGLLLTLLAVALVEVLSRAVVPPRSLSVLLAVVALVAYRYGLWPGLASAAIVSLYGVAYFAVPGQPFRYTEDGLARLALLPLAALVVALTVGLARRAVRAREAALRGQRDFLRAIGDSLAEGVYAVDPAGRVTFMNPAAERLLGWTQAELLGRVMHDVIHYRRPDGTAYPREECGGLQVLRAGVPCRTEAEAFVRKDGTIFPVAYSSAPIVREGRVTGLVVAFADITERRRAEDALRASEAKLGLLAAQLPAYGWATDTDLRVTSTFGAGLARLGVDPGAYLGKTLREVRGAGHPAAVAHARALAGEPATYETRLGGRDLEARVEPLRDADGRIVGCLGLALDATDRLRDERHRAMQQAVDRALAEATTLAEVAPQLLRAVGEGLGWDYGGAWSIDRAGDVLRCVATWHTPALALGEFVALSRGTAFAPGEGLPGQVWARGAPRWVPDVADEAAFPRLRVAAAAGLRAGVGVPFRLGGRVSGVLEFLARGAREVDPATLDALAALGGRLGQFIERAQAEDALRESETRKGAILAAALDAIVTIDRAGRVVEFNPAAERTFGYTAAEAVGRELAELIVPPALRERHRRGLARQLATGEGGLRGRRVELPARRADGSEFPAEVAITRLPAAGPAVFTGFVRDISARKRAEEELQARARQQAAVAALGQRALAVPDLDALLGEAVGLVARTLGVEYCKVLEVLPGGGEVLLRAGAGWRAGLVGRATVGAGRDSQAGYTLLSREPVVVDDLRAETRFGGPPLLHDHGVTSGLSVVIAGEDGPFGVLGAHTVARRRFSADDVNFLLAAANVLAAAIARKAHEGRLAAERAEAARLAELDRLRREFIASVSHEFRTPLTSARVGVGLLESGAADRLEPDEREVLTAVRRNIERLTLYVDDLLTINQLEAGVLQLRRAPLDLRVVVAEAAAAVQPLLGRKGQTLEVALPAPLLVEGDARRLEQVFVNLTGNAHEHTPAGTRIVVTGREEGATVCVTVRDDGPGIPAEHLEPIFERFQRVGQGGGGSGLGLAVVRSIAELHGGRVWAESAPGAGAAFHVALPRAAPAGEGAA